MHILQVIHSCSLPTRSLTAAFGLPIRLLRFLLLLFSFHFFTPMCLLQPHVPLIPMLHASQVRVLFSNYNSFFTAFKFPLLSLSFSISFSLFGLSSILLCGIISVQRAAGA